MPSLNTSDRLLEGSQYRHGAVMVESYKVEHVCMDYHKIPKVMDQLLEFINEENISNDLVKAGFSTKQLEKDYVDVAYATIYNFVNKFENYGLLRSEQYSNRRKYFIFEQG